LDCKLCSRQKRCPDKDKPPKDCVRFVEFADSKRFEIVDRVMRQNRGVYVQE